MKNYKKLYNTLIKSLKSDRRLTKNHIKSLNNRSYFVEKTKFEEMLSVYDFYLKEYILELEGKKWSNIFLSKEEFKEWKKEINK